MWPFMKPSVIRIIPKHNPTVVAAVSARRARVCRREGEREGGGGEEGCKVEGEERDDEEDDDDEEVEEAAAPVAAP